MIILGIETSCDETAACIIEVSGPLKSAEVRIRANITLSQAQLHAPYGGVFPNLAKREHIKNLPIILKEVFAKAKLSENKPNIDAIAVTYGPGLEPCLWAGILFAQEFAKKWSVLLVPVNHMEGHIFSALLRRKDEIQDTRFKMREIQFPALALLISGGHTELDLMEEYGKYRLIGETRDDAVGEAFDKVARLLGLPYPGGPEISRLAEKNRTAESIPLFALPRPMLHSPDYDFSFSGIKTAVLYLLKRHPMFEAHQHRVPEHTSGVTQEIAREFEDAVTEVLVAKTKHALREYGAQTLIVAGGVIANTHIRREFTKLAAEEGMTLLIPEISHTTDNALMIAVASYATALSAVEGHTTLPAPETIRAEGTASISTL